MLFRSPMARLRPGTVLGDGCKLGNFVETKNAVIGQGSKANHLAYIGDAVIGDDCKIQGSVYISDKTIIGNNVFIGPGSVITNDKYPPSGGDWSPVFVENDVVIGGNCTIIAGVILSQGCVIGAGSVVTKNIPSNEVWAGNPATFMMSRDEYENRRESHE